MHAFPTGLKQTAPGQTSLTPVLMALTPQPLPSQGQSALLLLAVPAALPCESMQLPLLSLPLLPVSSTK
jgi:hypothetical protein